MLPRKNKKTTPRNRSSTRGQIFTADALVAFVFLLAILGIYFGTVKQASAKLAGDDAQLNIADASETALMVLLSEPSQNEPAQELHTASLLTGERFLSSTRISALSSLCEKNPERARELLGLYRFGGGYSFSLTISDFSGAPILRCASAQKQESASSLSTERFAVLDDGRPVKISLSVWER